MNLPSETPLFVMSPVTPESAAQLDSLVAMNKQVHTIRHHWIYSRLWLLVLAACCAASVWTIQTSPQFHFRSLLATALLFTWGFLLGKRSVMPMVADVLAGWSTTLRHLILTREALAQVKK
jgi:hypothetical protein